MLVPSSVIALAQKLKNIIVCNLRPNQRSVRSGTEESNFRRVTEFSDGETIDFGFYSFLETITQPTQVVILYQGYGTEVSTVVAELRPIACWAEVQFPRLDFIKPENWNHCPNMWGSFVLAIARVHGIECTEVIKDQDATQFAKIVTDHGVTTELPDKTRSTKS